MKISSKSIKSKAIELGFHKVGISKAVSTPNEKQKLESGQKAKYILAFYLDPEMVNDLSTRDIKDVTLSYTFFSSDYY